ncbi:hypothetical protein [Pelosinus sp. IPA-1]|uniref:hypothetical protein n=1 Tax=Pelosinus sp. IPA-1 TaxID=3029569 RepID=UPI0024361C6E|nr:hypothetical protein [Pelosinus sp. IPA-1]GMB00907.1 hypothetical protein PIPA1_37060 [Pelosinus sp. IPA-1]
MTRIDELTNEKITLTEGKFLDFVLTQGINNVRKEDLIKIVSVHKLKTWEAIPGFNEFFYYKMAEENNRGIEKWTKLMGWLTIIMAVMTAAQVYKAFYN